MNPLRAQLNCAFAALISVVIAGVFICPLIVRAEYMDPYQYGYQYQYSPYAYPSQYQYPYYPAPYYWYQPLTLSCFPDSSNIRVGDRLTWTVRASGGDGVYSYRWIGQGMTQPYGYGRTLSAYYLVPGTYSLTVYVTSDGQTASRSCGTVEVEGSSRYQPPYLYPYAPYSSYPNYPAYSPYSY